MTEFDAKSSVQPGGFAPYPIPKVPAPQGMFEQLIFLNATPSPVTGMTLQLEGAGGLNQYEVVSSGTGPLPPNDCVIHEECTNGLSVTTISATILVAQSVLHLPPYIVQAPGHTIFRLTMGVAARVAEPIPQPFCSLLLVNDADPAHVTVELVPAGLWI